MVIFLQNAHTPRFSVDFAYICIQIFPKFYVFICINTVKMLLYMQIFLGVVSLLNPEFSNSYLQVDSQKIVKNMHSIQAELGPGVECIPVLKDNAYCLGALPIAKALCDHARIRTLAVAQVCEGAELREAGLNAPAILVLGGVPQRLFAAAVHYQLQLTVFHPSAVYALERLAQEQGTTAQVQIKIETGLNRTGAKPGAELAALIDALSRCPHIHVAGAFSHFATGETKESPLAYRQFALYQQGLAQLKGAGIDPPQKHMCNSGGSDWYRASFCNAVRIGRRLYMDNQAEPHAPGTPGAVEEVCSWRASVTNLRTVEAGETVGYGDGVYYPLAQAGGPLLVGQRRARLLATCMDQCFVDVTGLPCQVGDEVTFFGCSSAGTPMPIQDVGKFLQVEGVYFYSFLSPRVVRIYTPATAP